MADKPRAPSGDLSTYTRDRFEAGGMAHDIYRKGSGPCVIVITEMPGISPQVLGFADRVAAMGCSVVVPQLFGQPGRKPTRSNGKLDRLYVLRSTLQVCVSREFTLFATGRASPVTGWLRALARHEHARAGGPGVGVVGMCFTGGFALAVATEPVVLAPVLSQPSVPQGSKRAAASIDCSSEELDVVAKRCEREGLRVLGLRFEGDPFVPAARFRYLKERLGDGFIAVELPQSAGHPDGMLPKRHSVLTSDLIDAPGEPTRAALDQVLDLFRRKLLA